MVGNTTRAPLSRNGDGVGSTGNVPASGGTGPALSRSVAVEIRGLTKRFGRATVLQDVDLDLHAGEVHALIGQNGSGKSTLIKILSGIYQRDRGTIKVAGAELSALPTPAELRDQGLAFVHQDLGLVPQLSVLENIRVGHYEARRFTRRIAWQHEREAAERTLKSLQADFSVDRPVRQLGAGSRALVAIARALQGTERQARCIVFDESTQSLPRESLQDFYNTVRELAVRGTAVLIVTHRLEEVGRLADRVTVLRDGRAVAVGQPVAGMSEAQLSHLVLGKELETTATALHQRRTRHTGGGSVLEVRRLSAGRIRSLDLSLSPGEVVGITGPTDSGHEDVPYVLGGSVPATHGTLTLGDQTLKLSGDCIRSVRAAGIVLIPQQRLEDGLCASLSALENLTLPRVSDNARLRLRRRWQHHEFARVAAQLSISPAEPHAPIAAFSGGNQQKVLLAKWLCDAPKVLLAHEPTQAVDVGARAQILQTLRAAAQTGMAILISSVEAQDLAAICDRVLVLRNGTVHVQLDGDLTPEAIAQATYEDLFRTHDEMPKHSQTH